MGNFPPIGKIQPISDFCSLFFVMMMTCNELVHLAYNWKAD